MFKTEKLFKRLIETLDLPPEATPRETQVLLSGDRQVTVDGHRGVRLYGPERIEVRSLRACVCIDGRELRVSLLNTGHVVIRGTIRSVCLEDDR